jgi:hypothetical protein
MDRDIREVHGAVPQAGKMKNPMTLRETETSIVVSDGWSDRFTLTSAEARFLAAKLNRLALRLERRGVV